MRLLGGITLYRLPHERLATSVKPDRACLLSDVWRRAGYSISDQMHTAAINSSISVGTHEQETCCYGGGILSVVPIKQYCITSINSTGMCTVCTFHLYVMVLEIHVPGRF